MERRGQGLRKIVDSTGSEDYVEFYSSWSKFRVVLKNILVNDRVNAMERKIMNRIRNNTCITRK